MSADNPTRLTQLSGLPVAESPNAPPNLVIHAGGALYVQDAWRQIRWPVLAGNVRKALTDDLASVVHAAELRLGLAS